MRIYGRIFTFGLVLTTLLALPAHAGDPLAVTIDGTLASGSVDWPSWSRLQTGRLNRDLVSSTCGAPKACAIFSADPGRPVDVYGFKNVSGSSACVDVTLSPSSDCNLQVNSYLRGYNPQAICADYLADPGKSSGSPPSPFGFSFNVPAGENFFLPVHTLAIGETGCTYDLTMQCDGCAASRETLFAANNGFAGNTFDVTPKVPIRIARFDVNLTASALHLVGATMVEIYVREGTAVGHESSAAGWQSLGAVEVFSSGEGFGTPVLLATPLLAAGQTYGFYVDLVSYPSNSLRYTNGSGSPTEYDNEHLTLVSGVGKGNPAFTGSTFSDRIWNGRISYFVSPYVFADGFESGTPCFWNTTPTICL